MGYIGTVPALENINPVGTNSVETQDLQNAAVTTDKIANDTVTTDKIATSAVTAAKLAPGAAVPTQTGQTGKFLTTDGTTASWQTVVSGPTISSLIYSGNDLATDTSSPLPVTIVGSGFVANSKVYIDTITNANSATALQFSGTTQITFTPPAKSAASYNVWVVTPTGQMAVLVNGILYSGTPSWAGVNTSYTSQTAVNIQLSATSTDTPLTYSLVSGTLPTGVTLSSSGLLSGTVTGLLANTTFSNIVIRANDQQNQDASITIQLTINIVAQISRSLRFNSADSANLNRTPASAGNRQTWTWSGWVKRSALGARNGIFVCNNSAGNDYTGIEFSAANELISYDSNAGSTTGVATTQVFRDVSAWYHIVWAYDTTQATASNRVKLYVNGSQITGFSTSNYPPQNSNTRINSTNSHSIGGWEPVTGLSFNGYMAEVNFIDGQALTPASFGAIDGDTGVWSPVRYSGAYGTNGFYLNFSDNSNTTAATLGKDSSGNNNNWTPNNFSVTVGAGNDSVVDSPTGYGTDTGVGGEARGNYCTLSTITAQGGTISQGGLRYTGPSDWRRINGTIAVSTGKWYWEVTLAANPYSPRYAGADYHSFGIGSPLGTVGNPGNVSDAVLLSDVGYYQNFSTTKIDAGSAFVAGDVLSIAVDLDANTFVFRRNNTQLVSGTIGGTPGRELTPTLASYSTDYGVMDFNFGQRPFAYAAPSGFKALCTQNLPTPTIGTSSATLANKYFNDIIWTGNGVNPRQITGVGFQPDLVWTVRRDVGYGNWLYDVLRGPSKPLKASDTSAEATYTQVSSFDADGFTQSGTNDQGNNINGGQYVAWNWKAGGTGVANTAGSLSSVVSANTTSRFSIVSYTGNSSSNQTVGHGLGITPAMIICKARNLGSASNWVVWHKNLPNLTDSLLLLNTSDSVLTIQNYWGSSAPNSTVFGVKGGGYDNNHNGIAQIAYCFAEVPGYSRFGSYVGNGSSSGPFIYCGFRPAFIMIKNAGGNGSWGIFDSSRNPTNGTNFVIQANNPSSEGTFTVSEAPDFVSNGFKLNFGYNDYNSAVQYVFAAFAETPFKYALAR